MAVHATGATGVDLVIMYTAVNKGITIDLPTA
jgi:hypothetical protein